MIWVLEIEWKIVCLKMHSDLQKDFWFVEKIENVNDALCGCNVCVNCNHTSNVYHAFLTLLVLSFEIELKDIIAM